MTRRHARWEILLGEAIADYYQLWEPHERRSSMIDVIAYHFGTKSYDPGDEDVKR